MQKPPGSCAICSQVKPVGQALVGLQVSPMPDPELDTPLEPLVVAWPLVVPLEEVVPEPPELQPQARRNRAQEPRSDERGRREVMMY